MERSRALGYNLISRHIKYEMFELDDNMRRELRSKVYEDLHDSELV
jgi:hypothetical protein